MLFRPTKDKKRNLGGFDLIQKGFGLKAQDVANIAGLAGSTWSLIQNGKKDVGLTAGWRAATAYGFDVDDVLNMHSSSVDRLLAEHRPLFRLPFNIDNPHIVAKINELNNPKLLKEEHYWAGGFNNRGELLIATTRKIAQKELETDQYKKFGLSAFVPLEKNKDGYYPVIDDPSVKNGLKVGAAFTAICRILGISNVKLSEMTGLSRVFFQSLQNDTDEPTLGNFDIAAAAVGLTTDEVIRIAHPNPHRWPFHVQHGRYINQEMYRLLTSPDTVKIFNTNSTVEGRAALMISYRSWLLGEALRRESGVDEVTDQETSVITPAAFRLLDWNAA